MENGVINSGMVTGRCAETSDVMAVIMKILYEEKRREALSQLNFSSL